MNVTQKDDKVKQIKHIIKEIHGTQVQRGALVMQTGTPFVLLLVGWLTTVGAVIVALGRVVVASLAFNDCWLRLGGT